MALFGAKEKEGPYYYKCVSPTGWADMTYLSPRNREAEKMNLTVQERLKMGYENKEWPHPLRVYAADPMKNRPADIIVVDRKLAWFFTEAREKQVSRPKMDPRGFPMTRQREMKPKLTKIKFELLERPMETEIQRAIPLKLREIDYEQEESREPAITEVV